MPHDPVQVTAFDKNSVLTSRALLLLRNKAAMSSTYYEGKIEAFFFFPPQGK